MQLTRFDRWLREKYVYETHIQTLRPPKSLPDGIRTVEIPDVPGKRYKHLFVAGSSKLADELIAQLRENSQMYTTQIVDRDAWFVHRAQGQIRHLVVVLRGDHFRLLVLRADLSQRSRGGPRIPQKLHRSR